jgi:hypothetical protein
MTNKLRENIISLVVTASEILQSQKFNSLHDPEYPTEADVMELVLAKSTIDEILVKTSSTISTIGSIIREYMLQADTNEKALYEVFGIPEAIIARMVDDNIYTNCVPVGLFYEIVMALMIPFSKIEAAMIPTFQLVRSKETSRNISNKISGHQLWENEESVLKYTAHLKELMSKGRTSIH